MSGSGAGGMLGAVAREGERRAGCGLKVSGAAGGSEVSIPLRSAGVVSSAATASVSPPPFALLSRGQASATTSRGMSDARFIDSLHVGEVLIGDGRCPYFN